MNLKNLTIDQMGEAVKREMDPESIGRAIDLVNEFDDLDRDVATKIMDMINLEYNIFCDTKWSWELYKLQCDLNNIRPNLTKDDYIQIRKLERSMNE